MSDHGQPSASPPLRLKRYHLQRLLGEGGMGQVYLAHDSELDRPVAVKVLPPHSVDDPAAVARFKREARALAQLSHPGIVQAYDVAEEDGRQLLVMEYVDGPSLAVLLRERQQIPPGQAAGCIHQIALALQHAHERGLIHRDIKPSNLLMTAQGQVKLLDLGLARFLQDQIRDAARTHEGVGMGTPDYAAPEQFRDAHSADARSDIYSLGCTLYHLIGGKPPFPGSSFSEKYEAHASQEPTPLEQLCPEVPAGLAGVVRRMMAKRPEDRFQTAQQVADALAPFVSASSVSFEVSRSTATFRAGTATATELRPRRRRRAWLATGALSLVALGLFLGLVRPGWLAPERSPSGEIQPAPPGTAGETTPTGPVVQGESPTPSGQQTGKQPAAVVPPAEEPGVLTVSQKPEGGGKYRTIGDALREVGSGQTIRVIDDGVYQERLLIGSPSRHRDVTLETSSGATIEGTGIVGNLIEINGVPGVTLRGFRLKCEASTNSASVAVAVATKGICPGVVLEGLTMEAPRRGYVNGIEMLHRSDDATLSEPVLAQRCTFRGLQAGITVLGMGTPSAVGGAVIRDNFMDEVSQGINIAGTCRGVLVAGNRICHSRLCGLQLEHAEDASGILIVNNTLFECDVAFRVWDEKAQGKEIVLRNNLFLTSGTVDTLFVDSGGSRSQARGPGDGKSILGVYRMSHNARRLTLPPGATGSFVGRAWIPPAEGDIAVPPASDVNTAAREGPDFLRPKADSILADAGAGKEDPSLPRFIGALPPEGAKPWSWERTWKEWTESVGPASP